MSHCYYHTHHPEHPGSCARCTLVGYADGLAKLKDKITGYLDDDCHCLRCVEWRDIIEDIKRIQRNAEA